MMSDIEKFLDSLKEEDINKIRIWLDNRDKLIIDKFKMAAYEVTSKFQFGIGDISYFKEFNNQDIVFFYQEFLNDQDNNVINDYFNYFGKLFITEKEDEKLYEVVRFNNDFKGEISNLDRSNMLKVPNFICLKFGILEFLKRRDL